MVRDEPTDVKTFAADGVRVDLEEHGVEDNSPGVPLASALIRSAAAVARLGVVRAITTLDRVAPGTEVVQPGNRRGVDPHGVRGQSSLNIGGHGVTRALSRGDTRVTRVHCAGGADPDPAMASKSQHQNQLRRFAPRVDQDAAA